MRASLTILSAFLFSVSLQGAVQPSDLLARQPLLFEKNSIVSDKDIQYRARGLGFEFALSARENQISFTVPGHARETILTRFGGARASAKIEELDPAPVHINYLIGSEPNRWRRDIATFGKLRVNQIYPGVDLIFYGRNGSLEYDFVIHEGADPSQIRFEISGVRALKVDAEGNLVLSTNSAQVQWNHPVLYQEIAGGKQKVNGSFQVRGRLVTFHTGVYNHSLPLIIDPVLNYGSFVGGANSQGARAIGIDASGNVYIAGGTISTNMPVTKGAFQTAYGGGTGSESGDAFVAKFNPAGQLLYLTYVGGQADETATAIAVDGAGDAYITGFTTSADFPVTSGVVQHNFGGFGGNACYRFGDAFVTVLNPSGSQLMYSTYLGGTEDDAGAAITLDSAGDAYVAGMTLSPNFPTTTGAYQTQFGGYGGQLGKPFCNNAPAFYAGDAFVAKINPTGAAFLFSTYLGGTSDDAATAIAIDSTQNVYVAGATLSANFPTTTGAFQTTFHGSDPQNVFFTTGDAFISKLNTSGSSLVYSTYLGGSGDDSIFSLVVDSSGTAYVAGSTSSVNFPVTANAVQPMYAGYYILPELIEQLVGDAFVARLNSAGTALLYSTYFGGAENDSGLGVAVDASGLIYLTGATDSPNFPITANATQKTFGGDGGQLNYYGVGDGFLAVINPNSTTPVFSTFWGGTMDDAFASAVLDGKGDIWITGNTMSPNAPVTSNAFQSQYTGGTSSGYAFGGTAILVEYSGFVSTAPVVNAVENAASNTIGIVSPGMNFVAYGTNLGPTTLVGSAIDPTTGLLSDNQGGVQILFNGVPAPIVYVQADQVSGLVPYEVAGSTSTQITVSVNGQVSAPLTLQVAAAAPGLYSANYTGTGAAVAYNQDGTLNTASNPAAPGSIIVLYGTGEGQTTPAGQDGKIASSAPYPSPVLPASVLIGGISSPNIAYAGAVPTFVAGIFQVNATVPDNAPSGAQPLVVQFGSFASQPNLTVFIQ